MKSVLFAALMALSAAHAADNPAFTLTATAQDFTHYFPTYLANGYFATMSAPRGTEGNLAYLVAFMDTARTTSRAPPRFPAGPRSITPPAIRRPGISG